MKRELPMKNSAGTIKGFYCIGIINTFRSTAGGQCACSLALSKVVEHDSAYQLQPASFGTYFGRRMAI